MADTLRADRVPPLSHRRLSSPALAKHARGSVVFDRAYAPSNWTKPSMATILTGVSPGEHRALTHSARLDEGYRLLSERMQEAGFYTAGVVTNGYITPGFGFGGGWDRMLHSVDSGRSRGHFVAADVARVLRERPEDRPLFLYVHTTDVHSPYSPPRRDLSLYDSRAYRGVIDFRRNKALLKDVVDGGILLRPRDRQRLVALYDGAVTYHDRQFARVRRALAQAGILDDALFVFTSDHGEELFDHGSVAHGGRRVYEELVRVPLLISSPGVAPTRRAEPVGLIDIVPTVLHATGLPADPALSGRSLLDPEQPARAVVVETRQLTAIVDGRFKLVVDPREGTSRLFDLVVDPSERTDRSLELPRQVERLRRLHAEAIRPRELAAARATTVATIDEATEARLRELGYLR